MADDFPLSDQSRIYVIGDIHGRLDLLDRVIELIGKDLAQKPIAQSLTVTLGDYIDRGPKSKGVLDRLAGNPFPTDYLALKGNHEELFEAFIEEPAMGAQWRHVGGLETLHSYGVRVSDVMVGKGFEEASKELRAAVPDAHIAFLRALKLSLFAGPYFLCHAGVRPGVPLERQTAQDLLWIRGEFLNSPANFGKVVVHGHTPIEQPEILPNRINIDTGAFATNRLTCLVLEGSERRFLATK